MMVASKLPRPPLASHTARDTDSRQRSRVRAFRPYAERDRARDHPQRGLDSPGAPTTLEDAERQHILATLEQTGWRVHGPKGAATLLGLKPTTLESRIKKLGLSHPR
jgi:transcriptional regulator with GAF, ATPase, and Fis domain